MSPEMFEKDREFNEKIDSWSLGVILYTILNNNMLFAGNERTIIEH